MQNDTLTQEKVVEVMRGERFVMLSCIQDGKIASHPMTPQQVTDDADVVFFIGLQGRQADALRSDPAVNLAFATAGSWLSVAGRAEFFEDRALAEELWDGSVDAYFPEGIDDPDLGMLRVRGESAQFWGVAGGKAAALAKIAKSTITGTRVSGDSGTTEL